ncbi:hypothetical protein [Streptomyces fagopyri]|uniref:hypothetical protein n=1 Tax=Streptomyces fagopyri TaxID=2662397 RepID=UPI00381542B1
MRLGRALATGVAEEQARADEEDLRRTGRTEAVPGNEEIAEPETSAAAGVPVAR